MNGTWKPGFYYGNIADGFTGLAKYGPDVSAKTKAQIGAKLKFLRAHPGRSSRGRCMTSPASCASRRACRCRCSREGRTPVYGMNWLVRGVIGSPKG
jgi:hypothetical protein